MYFSATNIKKLITVFFPLSGSSSKSDEVPAVVVAAVQGDALPTWRPEHHQALPGEDRGGPRADEQGQLSNPETFFCLSKCYFG